MKYFLLLFLITGTCTVYGQNKSFDYAYSNKKGICVYSVADKREYPVVKTGTHPCISPDGKMLAYTAYGLNDVGHIEVMDLNTRKINRPNTLSIYSNSPVWSPDGKMILCNDFTGYKGQIAIITIDNSAPPKLLPIKAGNFYLPAWAANNKIIMHDQNNVTIADLAGNIAATYNMQAFEGNIPELKGMMGSTSDEFAITPDGKKIVFCCEVSMPGGDDGPPSAVFVYDIANKRTTRLSPKAFDASQIFIKGNQVLFTASKAKSSIVNVYTVDMDSRNFNMLLPNCTNVTAKN